MKSRFYGSLCLAAVFFLGGCAAKSPPRHAGIDGGQQRLAPVLAGPLSGSVPSTPQRSGPNGNGTTGSIACQFLGPNRPTTIWWVDQSPTVRPGPNWEYPVEGSPATSITGFKRGRHWVHFYTAVPNVVKPKSKQISVPLSKTIVLNVQYQ